MAGPVVYALRPAFWPVIFVRQAILRLVSTPFSFYPAVFIRLVHSLFNAERGSMKDYYAALGIDSDAPLSAVKTAYRKKASEFHPDKNTDPDAPARFREVQEAYDLLSDPRLRKEYDENRQRSLLESPLAAAEQIWTTYMHKAMQ
ncbi:MAG TPA: DnaJ domain-containing protein [Herbaspirillum sp.]